jgi:hypothetical protein
MDGYESDQTISSQFLSTRLRRTISSGSLNAPQGQVAVNHFSDVPVSTLVLSSSMFVRDSLRKLSHAAMHHQMLQHVDGLVLPL